MLELPLIDYCRSDNLIITIMAIIAILQQNHKTGDLCLSVSRLLAKSVIITAMAMIIEMPKMMTI